VILTPKQIEILGIVVRGNGTVGGHLIPCDLDQIIERLSYTPTKEAIQFSIRNLIGKELIKKAGTEKRRDRRRVLISPTELGKRILVAEVNPCWVGSEEEHPITAALES
jgi:DNA-binding MarR family transcriptional regulator